MPSIVSPEIDPNEPTQMHNKYVQIGGVFIKVISFSCSNSTTFSIGMFDSPVKCEGIFSLTEKVEREIGSSKHGSKLLDRLGSKSVK